MRNQLLNKLTVVTTSIGLFFIISQTKMFAAENQNEINLLESLNRPIITDVKRLSIFDIKFKEENCRRTFTFTSEIAGKDFRCKICSKNTKNCFYEKRTGFSRCEIDPNVSPDNQLHIGVCANPGEVLDPFSNCKYFAPLDIPATSCSASELILASKKAEVREGLDIYAKQATRDLFSYLSLNNTCDTYKTAFHIDRLSPFLHQLGPDFMDHAFALLPFIPSDDDEISYYNDYASNHKSNSSLGLSQEGLGLTPTEIDTVTPSRLSDYLPTWMKAIGTTSSYAISASANALEQIRPTSVWTAGILVEGVTGIPSSYTTAMIDHVSSKATCTMACVAEKLQLRNLTELLEESDKAAGNVLTTASEVWRIKSGIESRLQESGYLRAGSDPAVQKTFLESAIASLKSFNESSVDMQKVLKGINHSDDFWQAMDDLIKNIGPAQTRYLQAKELFTKQAMLSTTDPKFNDLKSEVLQAESNLMEWQKKAHQQIEEVLTAIESSNPDGPSYKQSYLAFHSKYIEPLINSGSGEALGYKAYNKDWDTTIKSSILAQGKIPEAQKNILMEQISAFDSAWEKMAAGDQTAAADYELTRKNISAELKTIIDNSENLGLSRLELNGFIGHFETNGVIPTRYSSLVTNALKQANQLLASSLANIETSMTTLTEALKHVNAGSLTAADFFETHGTKITQLRDSLLDPDLYKNTAEAKAAIVEKYAALTNLFAELPEARPNQSAEEWLRTQETLKARIRLEQFGAIEAPWREGWSKELSRLILNPSDFSTNSEDLELLKTKIQQALDSEEDYFSEIRRNSADGSQLYGYRKKFISIKAEINAIAKRLPVGSDLRKSLDGFDTLIIKEPQTITMDEQFDRILNRAIESSKAEEVKRAFEGYSKLFDDAGNATESAAKMFNESLNPATMSEWHKAALKFVGITVPPKIQESVINAIESKKDEMQILFNTYPPKTVAEGEDFAKRFNELALPDHDTLSEASKAWWRSLGTDTLKLSGAVPIGQILYKQAQEGVVTYFQWQGFANEVITKAQARGHQITSEDVWKNFAIIEEKKVGFGILTASKIAGGTLGETFSKRFLSILPPDFAELGKAEITKRLQNSIYSGVGQQSGKTVNGVDIDLRNSDSFVDDLVTFKFGRSLLLTDDKNKSNITLDYIRLQYIKRFLSNGQLDDAALIVAKYFYNASKINLSGNETTCEPLDLLSKRIVLYHDLQRKLIEKDDADASQP